ncbi:MAG TPA: hypothetical protein VG755_19435 [Nannocystaceae bacterium]|nr:hypothetical protein [Nannocystaceae bacterium]
MRRAALFALALCACADDPGRYEAETVIALAQSRGDALGNRHTGDWNMMFTSTECTCDALETTDGRVIPLCLDPSLLGYVGVQTTEADGRLRLFANVDAMPDPDPLAMLVQPLFGSFDLLGSIDADGTIALGEVNSSTTVIGGARLIVRADGTITDFVTGFGSSSAELEADVSAFLHVEAADFRYDCRADYEVVGQLQPGF